MKLLICIVDDQDVATIQAWLMGQPDVILMSTSGGLFIPGQSTLLIFVKIESELPQIMAILQGVAARRIKYMSYLSQDGMSFPGGIAVEVGGLLCFVVNVVHFEQV